MSERMTKEEADRARTLGKANAWGRDLRLASLEDWKASRAEEARQAEVIKGLADEMEKLRPLVVFEVLRSDEEWRTAVANMLGVLDDLRKAGRLP